MSAPRRPNLLLITTDQQRHDALGINGNQAIETPNLDAMAAAGVNFTRGYVTCPVCIPARRSLLSGQSPETHGLRHYQDGLEWHPPTTLPAELSRAGYQTQLVGKMHMHPQGKRYGFDHIILSETMNWRPTSDHQKRNDYVRWLKQQGLHDHPNAHGINGNGRLVRSWPYEDRLHHNAWLASEAARFLCEDRDPSAPFFLHLSFTHPHPPLVPPREYLDRYLAKELGNPTVGSWAPSSPETCPPVPPDSATGPFDPAIIRRARAAYFALINHIDDCIAHVLERWMEYGNPRAKEPLYLLFSSDHGEMLGDHQLFRKSLGYEASAHVPFFVRAWNAPIVRGICDHLVCWEDIAPTLLELAGLPVPNSMDGRSLAPILTGQGPRPLPREFLFGQCGGKYHNLWLVDGSWKYLWFPRTGEEQLFHLTDNPHETIDRSAEGHALTPLRQRMAEAVAHRTDLTYDPSRLRPCEGRPPEVFWPAD